MRKIDNWKEITPVTGGGQSLPAGVYKMIIVKGETGTTQTDKEKLVLCLEVVEGEYQGFFSKKYKAKKQYNEKAAWPCLYHQVTEGEQVGRYKGVIMAIEASNPGYIYDFDETKLEGKICGCIFREEEFIGQDNKVHTTVKPYQIIAVEDMDKATVPEKKCVEQPQGYNSPAFDDDSPIPF